METSAEPLRENRWSRPILESALVLIVFVGCATNRMRIVRDGPATHPAADSVRLMTWNVGMLPGLIGYGSRDLRRARRICDEILEVAPDLVLLQEVFDEDVRALISRRLRSHYPHRIEKCGGGGILSEDSGLYVASSLPLIEGTEVFETYGSRGGLVDVERVAGKGICGVWVDMGEGRALGVFNTHLHADGGRMGGYARLRRRQIEQARAVIEASVARMVRTHKVSVVLLGDLNVVGEVEDAAAARLVPTEEYGQLLQMLPGAVDLVRAREPTGPHYTWDPPANSMIAGSEGVRQRLDYVLALLPRKAARRAECRGAALRRPRAGEALSDHYGLVVTVKT